MDSLEELETAGLRRASPTCGDAQGDFEGLRPGLLKSSYAIATGPKATDLAKLI